MIRLHTKHSPRRGAIVVLAAILLIVFLAIVAFAVDLGYVVMVQRQLQSAADAAALAGASQLLVPQMPGMVNPTATARAAAVNAAAEATEFCNLNEAGNVSLDLPDADVVVGYLANPTDREQSISAWSPGTSFPNTVQVIARRDSIANNPLQLMFARLLWGNGWNGQATAAATAARGYNITGFNSNSVNSSILPIAVDAAAWATFIQTGRSADGQVHDDFTPTPTGGVLPVGDGIPEFVGAYDHQQNSPGNFGLVKLNKFLRSDAAGYFSDWILHGPTPADLQSFGPNGLQATPASPEVLSGGPGLKGTLMSDFRSIVGQPRVMPLFSVCSGNGNNTSYTIANFVGVTVVQATGSGSHTNVVVQPRVVIDPTATYDGTTWTGSDNFIYPLSPLALVR